jgi:polysaccharide deacetylase family protein (PEP-CTERM system associated)
MTAIQSTNVLSVDVEDYFHVEAFSDVVPTSKWDTYACRVEANTKRLLDLLDECKVQGTFFILGWVAERFPELVREIVARGHEPGCHSYWHRLVYTISPKEFREETRRAKDVIEQTAGKQVNGYRAPSYSITTTSLWALEILVETGFTYDSSIFPLRHDIYGIPHAPRSPFTVKTASGPLAEYPLTTFRVWGRHNFPVGGGGYLRILPFWYTRLGFDSARKEGMSLIAYVHPWEIDPAQPRISGRFLSRLRHYTNLGKTCTRLRRLLDLGQFTSFQHSRLAETAALNVQAL